MNVDSSGKGLSWKPRRKKFFLKGISYDEKKLILKSVRILNVKVDL